MDVRSLLVLGAQYGDEGKGKIVDLLVERARVGTVVRFNGGANAGHTIVLEDGRFALHQVPSGILHPEVMNLIGAGVALDPLRLVEELRDLRRRGVECTNLRVSDRAHLVMPWHHVLDGHLGGRLGTTARGIGPCYEDRAARCGLRVGDLVDARGRVDLKHFAARVREVGTAKNLMLTRQYGLDPLDLDEILTACTEAAQVFAPQVADISELLEERNRAGHRVLYEGAQGALLDVDWGTYPYVTSSSCSLGGCAVGVGLNPAPEMRMGVLKAYATRVGEGPFPGELGDPERVKQHDARPAGSPLPQMTSAQREAALAGDQEAMGRWLRLAGAEFGTTTGRPRRTGWLDMVAVRHAVQVSGLNALALTKLDVLDGIPTLKMAVAYEIHGERTTRMPSRVRDLGVARPVYEELPGWSCLGGATRFEDLPPQAQVFVQRVAELAGAPVRVLSVGGRRSQSLMLPEDLCGAPTSSP